MNTLLLFFAFPVATIILSIILQKLLKNPVLVASTFFAIYLVIAFAFFTSDFLIFVIVYTILAYITATTVQAICKLIKNCLNCNNHCNDTDDATDNCVCCNLENINNSLESINDSLNNQHNNNNSCECNRSYEYMPQIVNRRYRR